MTLIRDVGTSSRPSQGGLAGESPEPRSVGCVRVAIVGAGRLAREHARAFQSLPNVELAGVASRRLESAQRFAGEFDVDVAVNSVDELFKSTRANLVIVAVSELSVIDVVPKVLDYPWWALLEKPVGINLEQAHQLCSLANGRAEKTFVALNRRQYGVMQKARAELQLDDSRRLIQVLDQQDTSDAVSRGDSQALMDNWMFINSIHVIDLIRFFGRGTITGVASTGWSPGTDSQLVSAVIDFSSGDSANYQGIWDAPGPWSVAVTTDAGRWEMSPLESGSYQTRSMSEKVLRQPSSDDVLFKAGIRAQAKAVVGALRGERHELVTLHESMATLRLIKNIYFPTNPMERRSSVH